MALEYISRVLEGLKKDLLEAFPEIVTDMGMSVWDILKHVFQRAGKRFVFVIDEWDAIFHMSFIFYPERKSGGEIKGYRKDFSCGNQL